MDNVILIVGAVLILVILFVIYRVYTMISLVRSSGDKKIGSSNRINAALMPAFLVIGTALVLWSSYSASQYFLPAAVSEHGKEIDTLFWVTMGVIGAVFFATHVLLFYFPYKYQFKEGRRASFYPDNNKLEVIWTIIPAIVLTLLVFSGWKVWRDITSEAPEDAVVVEIVGKQFNWFARYPGKNDGELGAYNYRMIDNTNELGIDFADEAAFDDFTAGEIHLPKGKPVLFRIRARDVLHSVFLPHFRLKMDAVPGMPTKFWFTPTKTTDEMKSELNDQNFKYELACTEVCGKGHFSMKFTVVVEEEEDFTKWVNSQKTFLASHPEYLDKVPANLKEKARKIAGIKSDAGAGEATASTKNAAGNSQAITKTKSIIE